VGEKRWVWGRYFEVSGKEGNLNFPARVLRKKEGRKKE